MNVYRTEFFAQCPANNLRIHYRLRIETNNTIMVEDILAAIGKARGYHEQIATDLHNTLGGVQTLTADHHGVTIETRRYSGGDYLDQTVGGMAGTPGY